MKNTRKWISFALVCAMLLSACTAMAGGAEVRAYSDIVFPDVPPTSYERFGPDAYAYDDMSKSYEVDIVIHNYGNPGDPKYDAVKLYLEKKFNIKINLETCLNSDIDTILSTRAAALDLPDLFTLNVVGGDAMGREFYEQGLLLNAEEVYRYMPATTQFVTKGMIEWSRVPGVEGLPFTTKYGVQDGVWGLAINKKWLAKFGMEIPNTKDELIAYAKACTFDDPDGNGVDDTYFMTAAGSGKSFSMLTEFFQMFGNSQTYADENGNLQHSLFNDVQKNSLMFLNELESLGVLAPDWFTAEWEAAKSLTLADGVGMLHYPADALTNEYTAANENDLQRTMDTWVFLKEPPIEGGKFMPAGSPGYLWCFNKEGFKDEGKLKRIAHMMDTMVLGGENFFQTIQGGVDETYEVAGLGSEVDSTRKCGYNDNGTFYLSNLPESKHWNMVQDLSSKYAGATAWQIFGLNVSWQRSDTNYEDPMLQAKAKYSNEQADAILNLDRWPNYTLISSVPVNVIAPELSDFEIKNQYDFIVGNRSFDEWEAYQQEWLNMGGRDVINAVAEKLGVAVPEYAK